MFKKGKQRCVLGPINGINASLGPQLVLCHLEDLKEFYTNYDAELKRISDELLTKYLEIQSSKGRLFRMNNYSPSLLIADTSAVEQDRIAYINLNSDPQLIDRNDKEGYYLGRTKAHFIVEKSNNRQQQLIGLLLALDTETSILRKLTSWSPPITQKQFSLITVLDSMRYKLLLLYEDFLGTQDIIQDKPAVVEFVRRTVTRAVNIFYRYLQCSHTETPTIASVRSMNEEVEKLIELYIRRTFSMSLSSEKKDALQQVKVRYYKEAEHPIDNLLLTKRVLEEVDRYSLNIDVVVGIRFGGIELPILLARELKLRSEIEDELPVGYMKISLYEKFDGALDADEFKVEVNPDFLEHACKGKDVLLVDDNITSGRSLAKAIEVLRPYARHIYFACVGYTPYRDRSKQFEKDGVVNPDILLSSAMVATTNYTRLTARNKGYKKGGHFDKDKRDIAGPMMERPGLFDDLQKEVVPKSLCYVCHKDEFENEPLISAIERFHLFAESHGAVFLDDWIKTRVAVKQEGGWEYVEPRDRSFMREAIDTIQRSATVVFFVGDLRDFTTLLHYVACYFGKRVIVFYENKKNLTDDMLQEKHVYQIGGFKHFKSDEELRPEVLWDS